MGRFEYDRESGEDTGESKESPEVSENVEREKLEEKKVRVKELLRRKLREDHEATLKKWNFFRSNQEKFAEKEKSFNSDKVQPEKASVSKELDSSELKEKEIIWMAIILNMNPENMEYTVVELIFTV